MSDTNYPRDNQSQTDNPFLVWIQPFLQFLVMPFSLHVPWSYPSTNMLTWPIQIAPKSQSSHNNQCYLHFSNSPLWVNTSVSGYCNIDYFMADSILLQFPTTIIPGLLDSMYYMVALYVEIPQHYKTYPSPTLLKSLHFLHFLTATPETAFLHAISAAAITYELTLKCRYNIVGCYCVRRRVSNSFLG